VLTDYLGAAVHAADGRRLGRISDLAIVLSEPHPPVIAVLVRAGRGKPTRVPWSAVASIDPSAVRLTEKVAAPEPPTEPELLLGRDVLDTQIFDVAGKRFSRVADVELAELDGALRVVAVDVGWGPVLHRLGLGFLAGRAGRAVIDWNDLHLASARGHALQLATPGARVHSLTPHELAELVARLPPARGSEVLARVHPEAAARARELQAVTPEARPRHRYGRILRLRRRAPS
jgi:sporulation protein YlmC with PRC-barrel domain